MLQSNSGVQSYRIPLWSGAFVNVCIANFLMACSFNLLMPSIPLYITEVLHVPQTMTGIVLASYAVALLVVRPFSGYLADRYQRKKMLLLSYSGYTLVFLGYLSYTGDLTHRLLLDVFHLPFQNYAITIGLFIAVRFLHGVGWGMSTVSASTLAIDVLPSQRRAEGIGYYGTFMNVAMAVGPFVAIHLYQHYGFNTLLVCAIAMGLMGITAAAMIKAPKRQPAPSAKEKLSLDRFFLLPALPIFLNQLLPSFAWGTIGPFVAQYGKSVEVANPGIFFLFWAGGIILSRVFAGKLVDRGYIHHVNTASMFIAGIAFFSFASINHIVGFCISGLFIGVAFGMMFPALQTLYINIAPSNKRGTANSTYLMGFDLGLAMGMLLGGYISGIYSFHTLYYTSSSLCLTSIAVYLLVSRPLYNKLNLNTQ